MMRRLWVHWMLDGCLSTPRTRPQQTQVSCLLPIPHACSACLPPPGLGQAVPPTCRKESCRRRPRGGVRDSVFRPTARLLCLNPPPAGMPPFPSLRTTPLTFSWCPPTATAPQCLMASRETHMAGVASSGALIRVPSFSRWQNSSLICTPGYGEAPDGRTGWGWVRSRLPLFHSGLNRLCPGPLGQGVHPAAPSPRMSSSLG